MNNYICNFCNSNLSTSRNLTRHKKQSIKCIEIQNKKIECLYCNDCFDKENAYIHIIECSSKRLEEKEKIIFKLEEEKKNYENIFSEHELKYKLIESELNIYKELNKELLKR